MNVIYISRCVYVNGFIYLIGGFNGQTRIKSCDVYDPANQKWETAVYLKVFENFVTF